VERRGGKEDGKRWKEIEEETYKKGGGGGGGGGNGEKSFCPPTSAAYSLLRLRLGPR